MQDQAKTSTKYRWSNVKALKTSTQTSCWESRKARHE